MSHADWCSIAEAGLASEFDVSRARTELESVRSEALAVDHRRAIAENALAILTGKLPADFSVPSRRWRMSSFPFLPACLQVCWAAAGHRGGGTRNGGRQCANRNGESGLLSQAGSHCLGRVRVCGTRADFDWSSRTFLLGPLVGGALSLPLFDGGARRAQLDYRLAQYEEDVAIYRQTVLTAFREVEDGLAGVRFLKHGPWRRRLQGCCPTDNRTRAAPVSRGHISQLDVIDAERFS